MEWFHDCKMVDPTKINLFAQTRAVLFQNRRTVSRPTDQNCQCGRVESISLEIFGGVRNAQTVGDCVRAGGTTCSLEVTCGVVAP